MNGGGAEKLLLQFIIFLHDHTDYEIYLLLTYNTGVYLGDIPGYVKKQFVFSEKSPESEERIRNDIKTISKKYICDVYDCAVAFLEGSSTKILAYADIPNKLKYAWVHIDLEKRHYTKALYNNLEDEKECYRHYNRIAIVSKGAYDAFLKLFGIEFTNKLQILYNPINVNEIIQKATESFIVYPKYTICTAGRLVTQKGFDRLIQAAAQLKNLGYDFNIVILGNGARKNELLALIKECRLENNVFLYGFIKNPYPYMAASDLYICSSRTEGYCLAVCEAIALGKPVISTQCTGVPEIFELCNCGNVFSNNIDGITSGIKKCLDDHEYMHKLQSRSEVGRNKLTYKERFISILQFLNIEIKDTEISL